MNLTVRKKKIRDLYEKGHTVIEIVDATRYTTKAIHEALEQEGLIRNVKAQCTSCKYGTFNGQCNYLVLKGKRRGCPQTNCEKWEVGERISFDSDTMDNGYRGATLKKDMMYSQATFDVSEEYSKAEN